MEMTSEEGVPDTSLGDQSTEILRDDVAALGLPEGQLWYYAQARPTRHDALPRFYQGAVGSVYDVLKSIPAAREDGFNLPDGQPERTHWDGLRVVWPEEQALSISRNGITTAIMGQRFLTWGAERFAPKNDVWINPLALVEFTFEFWRFYVTQVLERSEFRNATRWRVGMRNIGGSHDALLPAHLLARMPIRRRASPARSTEFDVEWKEDGDSDPGRLAFKSLVEVYAQFGLGEDLIPCSEDNEITADAILKATGRE